MAGRLQKIKPIVARTVLREDEEVVGRHTTGQDIISRTHTMMIAEDVLDKDGNEVWKSNHLGIPISKVRRKVPTEVTEVYVYDDVGGGHNHKIYDFRPPADEIDKRERLAGIERLRDEYFAKAYDRGDSASDIIDREASEEEQVGPQQQAKERKVRAAKARASKQRKVKSSKKEMAEV